ncbi:hypothetical protein ACHAWF_000953, partial [Thalassiosira exigua]
GKGLQGLVGGGGWRSRKRMGQRTSAEDAEAKQAWQEKVAICFCIFLVSVFFVGAFKFLPVLLCQERTVYTLDNVWGRTDESWIVLHRTVYEVGKLLERHPTGPQGIKAFLHDDASRMFLWMPPRCFRSCASTRGEFEKGVLAHGGAVLL